MNMTPAALQHEAELTQFVIRLSTRDRLAILGHIRRLPETTPAHTALKFVVDPRSGHTAVYQKEG